MSLPISPTAVLGAVRMAGRLAGGVADAISFDDVLRGSGAGEATEGGGKTPEDAPRPLGVAELVQQTVGAIREKLSAAGLAAGQPLQMRLDSDAELRTVGDHQQAAAIETLLASDSSMRSLAGRLHQAGGPRTLTIPPTSAESLRRPSAGGPT